jgi:hypothetical protein
VAKLHAAHCASCRHSILPLPLAIPPKPTTGQRLRYGISGEVGLCYLWFIVSVLALDWSRYGLLGVESAMLETRLFSVPHTVGLLSHSDASWSGPMGWSRALMRFINRKGGDTGSTSLSSKLVLIFSMAERPSWCISPRRTESTTLTRPSDRSCVACRLPSRGDLTADGLPTIRTSTSISGTR